MRNKLIYLSVIFIYGFIFPVIVYGQSGCEQANWGSPLERELKVTRPFNPAKKHYGVDYVANEGDNVLAVADGTILKTGDQYDEETKTGWGQYVVIKHSDKSTTLYAHLVEDSTNHLYEGMPIGKGQQIGNADATGGVRGPTGNHLHLEYSPTGEWDKKLKKKDPHPCLLGCPETPATLTLSGPDAPSDGSQYTASGGTEPYTWSITKGAIDSNGVVTVSGQCGTSTITATDSCGNIGSKDVRMPNGKWYLVSYTYYKDIGYCCWDNDNDECIECWGGLVGEAGKEVSCATYAGNFRYDYTWFMGCYDDDWEFGNCGWQSMDQCSNYITLLPAEVPGYPFCNYTPPECSSGEHLDSSLVFFRVREWRCP